MPSRRKNATPSNARRVAVGYVRISKDRDDETSTETQEASIRAYCAAHGIEIVDVLVEPGRSAYSEWHTSRPQYKRARALIEAGAANVLVVWKLNRVGRNAEDTLGLVRGLGAVGAEFVSVTESFDTHTASGRMMLTILAAVAQMESDQKSEVIGAWQDRRREKRLTPTGPRAYGYRQAVEKGEKVRNRLVIHDDEAAVIREAAAGVLAGESLRSICARLNSTGVKPRLGAEFTRRSLKQILTRPTVAGLVEIKEGVFERGKGWEPILDRPDWDELRRLLLDPKRHTGGRPGHVWLLSGIATCSKDDTPMQYRPHQRSPRYGCPTCLRTIDAAGADEVIERAVLGRLDKRTWKRLRSRGRHVDTTGLETQLAQATADFEAGEFDDDPDPYATFKRVRDKIRRQIADVTATPPVQLPDVDDVRAAWADPTFSITARRLIVTATVEVKILERLRPGANTFDPDRVQISYLI